MDVMFCVLMMTAFFSLSTKNSCLRFIYMSRISNDVVIALSNWDSVNVAALIDNIVFEDFFKIINKIFKHKVNVISVILDFLI